MADAALYALIGLALLLPLEIFILAVIAALRKKPSAAPVHEEKQGYEWEQFIRLKEEAKPASSGRLLGIIILVFLAVALIASFQFVFAPMLSGNFTNSANFSALLITSAAASERVSAFSSIQLLPEAAPGSGLSDAGSSVVKDVLIVLGAVVAVVAAFFVILFFRRIKAKPAVPKVPEKAAVKKVSKATAKKSDAAQPSGFGWKWFVYPVAALLFFAVIALLLYFLGEKITGFAALLPSFYSSAKAFASGYRLFIISGIVVLVVAIFILRRKRSS